MPYLVKSKVRELIPAYQHEIDNVDEPERTAALVQKRKIKVGLHLNFTEPFSRPRCFEGPRETQQQVARYLLRIAILEPYFFRAYPPVSIRRGGAARSIPSHLRSRSGESRRPFSYAALRKRDVPAIALSRHPRPEKLQLNERRQGIL